MARRYKHRDPAREQYIASMEGVETGFEVITWCPGEPDGGDGVKGHPYTAVLEALKANGLPQGVARTICAANAFRRACKYLTEERVIDIRRQDAEEIVFQFTRRFLKETEEDGEIWEYARETDLILNKSTGTVACSIGQLQEKAQSLVDHAIANRTASDVTAIVQKLFQNAAMEKGAKLISLRRQGGAYMVKIDHKAFVDQIEGFLESLGGWMDRLPVPTGTKKGDESIHRIVVSGIGDMIEDYRKATQAFGETTRGTTLEAHAEKLKVLRFQIEAHRTYLRDEVGACTNALDEGAKELRARIDAITAAKDAEHTCDCEHCGCPNVIKEGQKGATCRECRKVFSIEWQEAEASA